MRTENEIVDMFVHVAACCENDDEPCPFFYSCSCTDDACREQWELWLSHRRRSNTYGQE